MQREFGNIQEVIVQNFRVKEDIAMRHRDEPSVFEMLRTIAAARLILGPEMNIQAPPNLTPDAYGIYLLAGINDWGGVSPLTIDHISPEAPWPKIEELREVTEEAGFELRERLAIYPEFATNERFVRDACRPLIERWTDESGLVRAEEHAYELERGSGKRDPRGGSGSGGTALMSQSPTEGRRPDEHAVAMPAPSGVALHQVSRSGSTVLGGCRPPSRQRSTTRCRGMICRSKKRSRSSTAPAPTCRRSCSRRMRCAASRWATS